MNLKASKRLARWTMLMPIVLWLVPGCPPPQANDNTNSTDPPPGQTIDSDNDGVSDDNDLCPATPAGAAVDSAGCAASQRDADGDGVSDDRDQCAETPSNTTVDRTGCPIGTSDADGDGVADANDTCPDTAGDDTPIDANGCGASQRDTDSDGVTDDIDQCADTPSNVTIDDVGCPVSAPGAPDADGDGVGDDIDQCADTPADATGVDANGCAPSQRDSDGDGVTDDADTCADTPAGETVDTSGCSASQRDSDGDGVNDDTDACPNTPGSTIVDNTGCPTTSGGGGGGGGGGPTGPVCGNGNVETGETCDPPDGSTCDANCQTITGGTGLANDACDTPTTVANGTTMFTNVGATTDGPPACNIANNNQIDSDIWFCYTAPCDDQVVVSLCGSQYDTKLAVYNGCGCPTATEIACSDDDCALGTESRASFAAVAGQQYGIRVGGFRGPQNDEQGTGTLTIFCESETNHGLNACTGGTGDCFMAHTGAGCQDQVACTDTCTADPFCCDTTWDALCAQKADGIVNGFSQCNSTAGDCLIGQTTPGCDSTQSSAQCPSVCQSICKDDPFCCLTRWDDLCAANVETTCGLFAACETATVGCFTAHAGPGCSNISCCDLVCAMDPLCCDPAVGWDQTCIDAATANCPR